MTAVALVTELRARGVTLIADGDTLRCRPASSLASHELETLRALKLQVLALLRTEIRTERLICYCCRSRRFWRSDYGVAVCAKCHPPPCDEFVQAWIDGNEDGR